MRAVKAVLRFLARSTRRLALTIAGFAVILVGVIMLVTPGPGLLVIAAGLAILSIEYTWARVLLEKTRAKAREAAQKAAKKVRRRRKVRAADTTSSPGDPPG